MSWLMSNGWSLGWTWLLVAFVFFVLVVFTISMVGGVIQFDCTGQIFSNSCSLVILYVFLGRENGGQIKKFKLCLVFLQKLVPDEWPRKLHES